MTEADFIQAIKFVAAMPMPPEAREEINGILRELAQRLPWPVAVEILDLIQPAQPLQ